jgi:hypothetical protein
MPKGRLIPWPTTAIAPPKEKRAKSAIFNTAAGSLADETGENEISSDQPLNVNTAARKEKDRNAL